MQFDKVLEWRQYYRFVTSQLFFASSAELLLASFALFAMRGVERQLGARFVTFAAFNAAFSVASTLFSYVVGASVTPTLVSVAPRPGPLAFIVGVAAAFVVDVKPLHRVEIGPLALRPLLTDKVFAYVLLTELVVLSTLLSASLFPSIVSGEPSF